MITKFCESDMWSPSSVCQYCDYRGHCLGVMITGSFVSVSSIRHCCRNASFYVSLLWSLCLCVSVMITKLVSVSYLPSFVCQCYNHHVSCVDFFVITKFCVSELWSLRSVCQFNDHRSHCQWNNHISHCASVLITEVSVSVLWSQRSVCQCYDHRGHCASVIIKEVSVSVLWSQGHCVSVMVTWFSVAVLWSPTSICHSCDY